MTEFATYLISRNLTQSERRETIKGDIKPRAQTIRQLHSSTNPQTQHLSSWLFEHWSCAISFTTHVSTILENPPFRTDEERNDNSRYRIPQALFSLTSSKPPLSLPVSHTSLIHRSSTLSQAVPLTYTNFYLVSTSIPNPIPSHRSWGNPPMD